MQRTRKPDGRSTFRWVMDTFAGGHDPQRRQRRREKSERAFLRDNPDADPEDYQRFKNKGK